MFYDCTWVFLTMDRLIWILLFLYLIIFPFGQLARLPIFLEGFSEVRVYVTDIIVGLMGILWFISWAFSKRKILPPFAKEMSLFVLALIFSFLLAVPFFDIREVVVAGLYLFRVIAYGLFYFAVAKIAYEPKSKNLLWSSLIVIGTTFAIFGFIQYLFFPDTRPFTVWGWDEHYMRLVGTFLDPGFTAIIMVFVLLLIISGFSLTPLGWKHRNLWVLMSLVLTFLALLFTYSRAGYVAFIVGMGTIAILQKKTSVFVFSFLSLVGGILLLQHLPGPESEGTKLERVTSTFARFDSWENAIKLWQTSPVFGVGFNFYRYALEKRGFVTPDPEIPEHGRTGSDSSLLFVLSTTGIVGFLLFAHLVLKIITVSLKINSDASITLLSSLMALAVHSLFLNSIFYAPVMGWLVILLALTSARFKGSR